MGWKDLSRLFSLNRKKTIREMSGPTMGRVVAVNEKTIDVQPTINRKVRGKSITLPVFREVPPVFMQGGTHYEAHPITVGDSCLLIVCERCFDAWYSGQNEVLPPEDRMFDYSDCVAVVGVNPLAAAITIPTVTTRRGDNDIEGDYHHTGDYDLTGTETHTGERVHTGDTNQTGDQVTTGEISATIKVSAPILSGVLTGVGGAAPIIPQSVTATELHADNGFTGTKTADGVSFNFTDGILIS